MNSEITSSRKPEPRHVQACLAPFWSESIMADIYSVLIHYAIGRPAGRPTARLKLTREWHRAIGRRHRLDSKIEAARMSFLHVAAGAMPVAICGVWNPGNGPQLRAGPSLAALLECGHGLTRPKPSVTYNGHLEGDRCSLLQAAPVAESTANVAFSGMNPMHRDGIQRNAQQTQERHARAAPAQPISDASKSMPQDWTRWSFRSFSVD